MICTSDRVMYFGAGFRGLVWIGGVRMILF